MSGWEMLHPVNRHRFFTSLFLAYTVLCILYILSRRGQMYNLGVFQFHNWIVRFVDLVVHIEQLLCLGVLYGG